MPKTTYICNCGQGIVLFVDDPCPSCKRTNNRPIVHSISATIHGLGTAQTEQVKQEDA